MSGASGTVRLSDVELNVVQAGEGGPALVLLHYWGGSSRTWAPVMERLATTSRCVAIDFRGWGRSGAGSGSYELDTLADDVIGVVRDLGIKSFALVGHSMGGKVAQIVAGRRPDGLERLVLVAPAPPTPLPVPPDIREAMLRSYMSRQGAEDVVGVLAARPLPERLRAQVVEDTLTGTDGAKRAWPKRGMLLDVSDAVSRIEVPITVVVGGSDEVEREDGLRAAFAPVVPDAAFITLPGVGHLSPLEAPDELADAIRAALH